MPKSKGYNDKCPNCNKEIWIPLNKAKVKIYCRECENRIRRGESINSIKFVEDKVDTRKQIETLRQIEVNNPALLEELRNEKEKKKNT